MDRRRHRTSTLSPSNSMLIPYPDRRLAVVPPTIPGNWAVEEVPRRDGIRSDTYYLEPDSGRKFRSIKEVHRYLNGEGYPCKSRTTRNRTRLFPSFRNYGLRPNPKQRRMIVSGGKLWRLRAEVSSSHFDNVTSGRPVRAAPHILPDGWIVEEVPRRDMDFTDKYYYDPETGRKFRSLVAVERFLAELDENENAPLSRTLEEIMENKPLAKVFKLENHSKSSFPMKKSKSQENTRASFVTPPMKVNWVLASPQGDVWNPFIADTLVPDAVKQQWTNRFMIFMRDGANNFPSPQA